VPEGVEAWVLTCWKEGYFLGIEIASQASRHLPPKVIRKARTVDDR
jgi:hypothetical protein